MTLSTARARFADHALAAYLGPLIAGRRVAVVGPSSGDIARRVRALGAQTVVSFGGQGEDIAVRALIPGAIAGFHGRLDLVLVPSAGAVPSLVAVLDEARRALGSEGVVVVVSEPEDGPAALEEGSRRSSSYHDLRDLCAARFAQVQMLGRGPFVGYTVASLDGPDGGYVALETRLMEGDPPRPEAIVAVASDSPVVLDALAVVQIPGEVVHEVREAASRALREEITACGQKLKDVESASAERWVKIQRFEHHVKELEEERNKTRDKAVKLSKDLDDERKLRQRIELDAQMARRVPELPKGVEEEARRAQGALGALESELKGAGEKLAKTEGERARAQTALEGSRARIGDLERELDETQAAEADLRAQLDEAVAREERASAEELAALAKTVTELRAALEAERRKAPRVVKELDAEELGRQRAKWEKSQGEAEQELGREHSRLENELRAKVHEIAKLSAERARMLQSVRELTFSVEQLSQRDLSRESSALRATLGEMRSVAGELSDRAEELVRENELLRDAVGRGEAEVEAAARRAEELSTELVRARAPTPEPEDEGAETVTLDDTVARERDLLRAERDALAERNGEMEARHEGALAGARIRVRELEAAAADLQRELIEERGSREILARSTDEARNDVSRLYAMNAGLEARVTHMQNDLESARASSTRKVAERVAEAQGLKAELSGMTFRAAECERALGELAGQSQAAKSGFAERLGLSQAEASGREYRLREAELALAEQRVHPGVQANKPRESSGGNDLLTSLDLELDLDGLGVGDRRGSVEQVLADLSATAERLAQTEEVLASERAENASLSTDLRLVVDKLNLRDLELRELQARSAQELTVVQGGVGEAESTGPMREVIEAVRGGISAILIDGRGAVVAHDLVLLLRRLEEV